MPVPVNVPALSRLFAFVPLLAALPACGESDNLPHDAAAFTEQPLPQADATLDGGDLPGDGSVDANEPIARTVARYDYTLDLATLDVSSALTFTEGQAGCSTLASPPSLTSLQVEPQQSARATQQDQTIHVCSSAPHDDPFTLRAQLTLSETTDPSTGVGYSRRRDQSGNDFRYLLNWLETCDRFGPCDRAPNQLSHFTFTVQHSADQVVLCAGIREKTSPTRTRCSLLDTRAPSYSSMMVAAHTGWLSTPLLSAAGVDVVLFETAQGNLNKVLDRDSIARFLSWLSELLGPFPYGPELRIASAPVVWLGMEHPANIIVRDDLSALTGLYQDVPLHTVLHEIAHQWAGNRVTLESTLDFAWKEAIAEYLVYTFEARERGAQAALSTRRVWQRAGNNTLAAIRPRSKPGLPLSAWSGGVTGSGPMALFLQLEPWWSEETLLRAIQRFLEAPGARSVQQLQEALEHETGTDLQRYFDAWVYGGDGEVEWPELRVAVKPVGNQLKLEVSQHHSRNVRFPCVVELLIEGASQRELVRAEFPIDAQNTSVTLQLPFAESVRNIRIDPDARLLDFSPGGWHTLPLVRFHP